jgi:hypothetical protein
MAEGFLSLVTAFAAGFGRRPLDRSPLPAALAGVGRLLDVRLARVDPDRAGNLFARSPGAQQLRGRLREIN